MRKQLGRVSVMSIGAHLRHKLFSYLNESITTNSPTRAFISLEHKQRRQQDKFTPLELLLVLVRLVPTSEKEKQKKYLHTKTRNLTKNFIYVKLMETQPFFFIFPSLVRSSGWKSFLAFI